ncbi:cytochrome P450 4C1 [Agrilus planipennis]|uniref:Cytochrome P450 4C1 n=1 Tax=Agrilus planipennis TaxID=224129 RepID=A0A7F5R670_AGRPL|nr:cytochrome P450 4C1 [Agrilus planipennis]
MEMKEKYGGMYPIYIGFSAPSLTITDPKFLEFLLGSTAITEKSSDYRCLHSWLGMGLLTSAGYRWRSHRKIITPAFHFKILESFIDVFEKNCSILIKKFEQEVGKNSFDVYPYVTLLALDIICETALGTEVYAQTNAHSEYVESVKDMCRIIMERTFNPFLQNDFIYKLSSIYRREKKALKILHNLTLSVLQTKRKRLLSNGSLANQDECLGIKKKLAFLDLLLQATVDGKPLSDTDLREEVDTFMFEVGITFNILLISEYQDVVHCRCSFYHL